jgi:hypothetical protein
MLGMRHVAALALVLSGCIFCRDPWNKFPMRTMPDRIFETGSAVAGARVYTWDCVNGVHVVIWQVSSEMFCEGAQREQSACGTLTPFEQSPKAQKRMPGGHAPAWQTK